MLHNDKIKVQQQQNAQPNSPPLPSQASARAQVDRVQVLSDSLADAQDALEEARTRWEAEKAQSLEREQKLQRSNTQLTSQLAEVRQSLQKEVNAGKAALDKAAAELLARDQQVQGREAQVRQLQAQVKILIFFLCVCSGFFVFLPSGLFFFAMLQCFNVAMLLQCPGHRNA